MTFKRTTDIERGESVATIEDTAGRSMEARLRKVAQQLNKTTDNALWDFAVHPSPPTISNGSAFTITSNYEEVHGWDLTRYTQLGSLPRLDATFGYVWSNTNGSDGDGVRYGFTLVGTECEIRWRAAASGESVWIWVDGQPITALPAAPSGITVSAGANYCTKITFASAGTHEVVVYPTLGQIMTIRTALATSSIQPLSAKPDCSLFVMGDSYTGGSALLPALTTWNWRLGLGLGFEMYPQGQGGTGYIASGTAGARAATDASRLDPVGEADPDLLLVVLGGNDGLQTPSAVQAAATAVYQGIASRAPNVPIIATGRYVSNSTDTLSTSRALVDKAIYDAAAAAPNVVGFIDMIGCASDGLIPATQVNGQSYAIGSKFSFQGAIYKVKEAFTGSTTTPSTRYVDCLTWLTGTGNASSPVNNGSRDLALSSDGVHWTYLGGSIFAARMVSELRRILNPYL